MDCGSTRRLAGVALSRHGLSSSLSLLLPSPTKPGGLGLLPSTNPNVVSVVMIPCTPQGVPWGEHVWASRRMRGGQVRVLLPFVPVLPIVKAVTYALASVQRCDGIRGAGRG